MFAFLFNINLMVSQDAFLDYGKIVPPNPTTASLIKQVITPVDANSGLPSIGIPLYTIETNSFSFPITLNYQSGGIGVSEEASMVGLGWALNSSGVISRSIKGKPDFESEVTHGTGYLGTSGPAPDPSTSVDHEGDSYFFPPSNKFRRANEYCEFPVNGILQKFSPIQDLAYEYGPDYQPDVYYFNVDGLSGSFIMKTNGEIFLLEKNDLVITWKYDPEINNNPSFEITSANGTKYSFKHVEKTTISPNDTPTVYNSSWFLTRI